MINPDLPRPQSTPVGMQPLRLGDPPLTRVRQERPRYICDTQQRCCSAGRHSLLSQFSLQGRSHLHRHSGLWWARWSPYLESAAAFWDGVRVPEPITGRINYQTSEGRWGLKLVEVNRSGGKICGSPAQASAALFGKLLCPPCRPPPLNAVHLL